MALPSAPRNGRSVLILDLVTAALFVLFLAFLFVGYENWIPKLPLSTLSAAPLLASLGTLFLANARADQLGPLALNGTAP